MPLRLGFVTAVRDEQKGYLGGYLITSRSGRPLEFQCSTPVKPNRTQEILYGPTLEPFVLGELIARTLVEKSGLKPAVILTDFEAILSLREHIDVPLAWMSEAPAGIQCHAAFPDDRTEAEGVVAELARTFDLSEPFERIRSALAEALQTPK